MSNLGEVDICRINLCIGKCRAQVSTHRGTETFQVEQKKR